MTGPPSRQPTDDCASTEEGTVFDEERPCRILPLLATDRQSAAIDQWLDERPDCLRVSEGDPSAVDFDLCIVDTTTFEGVEDALRRAKASADPVFLPVLLLVDQEGWVPDSPEMNDAADRPTLVDEIVRLPLRAADLTWRVDSLLWGRSQSLRMRANEKRLEQYKQAVESSKDLIGAVDRDSRYLFANDQYRKYHGLGDVSVTDQNLATVLGDRYAEVKAAVHRATKGRPVQIELVRTHPERGERILDARLFPLRGPDGGILGVGASMRDVTETRERAERIKREAAFRRLIGTVQQRLVRGTDVEPVLEDIVETLGESEMFGCTHVYLPAIVHAEVICTNDPGPPSAAIEEFYDPSQLQASYEGGVIHVADVTEPPYDQHPEPRPSHEGVLVSLAFGHEQFGVLSVHLEPGRSATAEEIDVLEAVGNDIAYFVANQRLESEHKSFAEIVERIEDPVMIQDLDGTFTVLNSAVEAFADMDRSALLGRDEHAFMDAHTADRIQELKAQVLDTERPRSYQVTPSFPDGRERTFSTTRYPYYDEKGSLTGTVAICRDVTDLEHHRQQLQVLDRVLRHNVNNNMNVIEGYASMNESRSGDPLAGYAAKIAEASDHLLELARKQRAITEFLSETHSQERIDLGATIDRSVARLRENRPAAAVTVHNENPGAVWANPSIEEALDELLENAVDHGRGTVSVKVQAGSEMTQVSVRDQNQPMPAMDRDVLRGESEFGTLKHGSGLGLWLVRLIVDHSDGRIEYAENEPTGNVVTVALHTV
jgi:PAS domain S-box-containing protein